LVALPRAEALGCNLEPLRGKNPTDTEAVLRRRFADERHILRPNLCAFAALREIFFVFLGICLEGVNMVLRTFRYGFYKPAYADKSG
jgi:hypothetical protein